MFRMGCNGIMKKNEKLLLFGRWSSKIGDILFDYVNNIVIVSAFTNSSWVLALYQSSQTIVNILFNIIGGAIADQGKRKRIIVIADLLSAVICFVTSFFIESSYMAIALIFANALLAAVFSFSSPTFKAIVRDVIEKNRINVFNSISNAGAELIAMIGPAAGAALLGIVGPRGALLINAVTFLISALSECFLVPNRAEETGRRESKEGVLKSIILGLQYLLKEKTILYLVILSAVVNFFLAGYNLAVPYTNNIYSGTFDNFYSKAIILEAVGGILGSFINSKLPDKFTQNYKVLVILLLLTGVSLALVPLSGPAENLVLCLLPFLLFGGFLTMYNINFMTLVQVSVDDHFLGRVFSVIFTVAVMFMPVGSFVFSFLNVTDNMWGFLFAGAGIMAAAILSSFCLCLAKPIE